MKNNTKKNEITKVAYNMFINKGYDSTSVDDIIAEVGIAKGTFYYYFDTKEQLLEEVINVVLQQQEAKAQAVLDMPLSHAEKIVAVIVAVRPTPSEVGIADALNRPENIVMHNKINAKIVDMLTPILSRVIQDGVSDGVFSCDCITERVRLVLQMSSQMFDDNNYTQNSVVVFVDAVEKILGAKPGSMSFICNLIK